MKTKERLDKLTKSIRLTNQAKMIQQDLFLIDKRIEQFNEYRLRKRFERDALIAQAHLLQREAIPVTIVPIRGSDKTQKVRPSVEKMNIEQIREVYGEDKIKHLEELAANLGWYDEDEEEGDE